VSSGITLPLKVCAFEIKVMCAGYTCGFHVGSYISNDRGIGPGHYSPNHISHFIAIENGQLIQNSIQLHGLRRESHLRVMRKATLISEFSVKICGH
jgi:hypothetical protein